jgi:hypothetical protein
MQRHKVTVESVRHGSRVAICLRWFKGSKVSGLSPTPTLLLLLPACTNVIQHRHLVYSFSRDPLCHRLYSTKSFVYYCTGVTQTWQCTVNSAPFMHIHAYSNLIKDSQVAPFGPPSLLSTLPHTSMRKIQLLQRGSMESRAKGMWRSIHCLSIVYKRKVRSLI